VVLPVMMLQRSRSMIVNCTAPDTSIVFGSVLLGLC